MKAVPRIQRRARAYEYMIVFKAGQDHGNADALGRLPIAEKVSDEAAEGHVLMMDHLDTLPVSNMQIKQWTGKDPLLSVVQVYVMKGWPEINKTTEFVSYHARRLELSVQDWCLMGTQGDHSHIRLGIHS